MLNRSLEYIEKFNQPSQSAEYVIIWLHGLGADYNDFVPLVNEMKLSKAVKFVFPNAPMRPVTINNGYVMRAWYDISDFSLERRTIDEAGILTSVEQIEELVKLQLENGFTSDKIILAGFSQGGAICYASMFLSNYKFAGIIALSTYLPDLASLNITNCKNIGAPIFAAHGTSDQVLPYHAGCQSFESLKANGFNISWYSYNMPHSVCFEEIQDLTNWLNQILI